MENEPDAPQSTVEPEPSPPPAPAEPEQTTVEPEPSPPRAPAEPEPLRPNSTITVRGGRNPAELRTNLVETHSDTDE